MNFESVKLNVVAMKGFNDDELCDFVEFIKDKPMEVRFIEFMPFDKNDWNNSKMISYFQIRSIIEAKYKLVRNQDGPNATSKVKLKIFRHKYHIIKLSLNLDFQH